MQAQASPSSRSYEKVTISCGLLNVPVEVFSGMTSGSGVKRKMFTDGDHEVGYATIDKVTGQEVSRADVVKKVETPDGFVEVTEDEIEGLIQATPKTITVKSFHPVSEWSDDTLVGDKLYYVEPTRTSRKVGGKTVKTEDASSVMVLGLLLKAMQEEGTFALVEWVSRGVPKPAVLLPDGSLWTVHPADTLRQQRPVDTSTVPEAALSQARALIQSMGDEIPVLTDEYTAKVQDFANAKAKGGAVTPVAPPQAPSTDMEDLLAKLNASVEAQKKGA